MAAVPPRPPFQRLRRVLLAAFAAVVLGVAGLYLLGRPASPPITSEDMDEGAAPGARPAGRGGKKDPRPSVVSSEGFEYEQRVGERSAFRLRGAHFTSDKEGVVTLQGVGLELTREDGSTYRVESRRATWDPRTHEARLSGDVHLSGAREFRLEADRLDLVEGGQTVVSRGAVRFGQGSGLGGRAGAMRLEFESDRFLLREKVRMSGRETPAGPRLGLEADSVLYQRAAHALEASGGVVLTTGADRLNADRIDVELTADEGSPRRATARGQVVGELAVEEGAPGGAGRAVFRGATLVVDFAGEPAQPAQFDLQPGEGQRVSAEFRADNGDLRTLEAPHLVVAFEAGKPRSAAAAGGVRLAETLAGQPAGERREATARRAEATFQPTGDLATVTLVGDVHLRQGDREATADRSEADLAGGGAVLTAAPGRVRVVSPRGELRAPHVTLEREHGVVHATGGVFAELQPGAGALDVGPASGPADAPTRVEAEEGEAHDDTRSWSFRGDVRASRGDSLLFADQLEGAQAAGKATASGHVRTIWKEAPSAAGEAPVTTTVAADRVAYDRGAGRAEYSGDVRVHQTERELACANLVVELDAGQKARRMLATGGVRIEDRTAGRRVTGESADHDVAARTILVEGSPVVLSEARGTTVRGHRVLYDLATGSARVVPEEKPQP